MTHAAPHSTVITHQVRTSLKPRPAPRLRKAATAPLRSPEARQKASHRALIRGENAKVVSEIASGLAGAGAFAGIVSMFYNIAPQLDGSKVTLTAFATAAVSTVIYATAKRVANYFTARSRLLSRGGANL